jgi:muramidase (phage lysozyme)
MQGDWIPPKMRALLDAVRYAEGTAGPQGYQTMFGGGTFSDMSRHPDKVVRTSGYASAAAGAYQFMPDTWKSVGGGPMTPERQDMAAMKLMQRRGVDIKKVAERGATAEDIHRLAPEWASLPKDASGKSYYGQPVKKLDEILSIANGGGQRMAGDALQSRSAPPVASAVEPQLGLDLDVSAPQRGSLVGALGPASLLAKGSPSPGLDVGASDDPRVSLALAALGAQTGIKPAGLALPGISSARAPSTPDPGVGESTSMRGARAQGAAPAGFEKPSSTVFETASGQPGVDFFFESKKFPAVLGGRVKDVRREAGYGNFIVVESPSPTGGKPVDVLYGHLADGSATVRPGDMVAPGQIIGTQGGTGNVRSADGTIASIDFLAPAPAGSGSMAPHPDYDRIRRMIARQLGGN